MPYETMENAHPMASTRLRNRVSPDEDLGHGRMSTARSRPILPPEEEIRRGFAAGGDETGKRVANLLSIIADQKAEIDRLSQLLIDLMAEGNEQRQRIADMTENVLG